MLRITNVQLVLGVVFLLWGGHEIRAQDTSGPVAATPEQALSPHIGDSIRLHAAGRSIKGRLVSVSDAGLVVAQERYPFPQFRARVEETVAADQIARVDLVDSNWNGELLGL